MQDLSFVLTSLKLGEQSNINIKIIASAPKNKEQNGFSERHWQECRKIAVKLLLHARLHLRFFDLALVHGLQNP